MPETPFLGLPSLTAGSPEGAPVEVAGERGPVEQIGPIASVFRDGERTWSMPNTRLLEEIVRR